MKNVKQAKLTEIKSFLESKGLKMPSYILGVGSDTKTVKGEKLNYLTGICYLIPSFKLCPASKIAECHIGCLVNSGLAQVYKSVNIARANRTAIYEQYPEIFYELASRDIAKLKRKAERENKSFCVRMNGTSDIDHTKFIAQNPDVQFYDYTKMYTLVEKATFIENYHITMSYSGASMTYRKHVNNAILVGANIAVVFRDKKLPPKFLGLPVISGDDSDLRFLDHKVLDKQCIIGLYAKGPAKQDKTGFVVDSVIDNNIIAKG